MNYRQSMLVLVALGVSCASAQMIDDFEQNVAPTTQSSTFYDGTMLGGERDVILFGVNGAPTPEFSITGGAARFEARGPTEGLNARAQFLYDGNEGMPSIDFELPDIDLTAGGSVSIVLNIQAIRGVIQINARTFSSLGNGLENIQIAFQPGPLEFHFDDFVQLGSGADLSAVKNLLFFFSGFTESEGPGVADFIEISSIELGTDIIFADGFENG